jgi:Uncharacterized Fe-S protein PflX, homolog of pyruvate formate lyase activating proteins
VDRRVRCGICGERSDVRIAWSGLHRGEEPPITGEKGSGMIFFSGCPLGCAYCQNRQISGRDSYGIVISIDELASIMLSLQDSGANTLNLVTGTHFIPSIIEALKIAKPKGFSLPVVWNSSGFESVEALEAIDPYIDLYLLDIKTLSPIVAKEFCGGEKYVKAIKPLVEYLVKARPETDLENLKGTLVRHLVFPGTLEATVAFLSWFGDELKDHFMLSLMVQFVNPNPAGRKFEKIKEDEYNLLLELLDEFEIDGFVQELGDEDCWIPDFTRDNPFPEPFANPLPYFLELKNSRS